MARREDVIAPPTWHQPTARTGFKLRLNVVTPMFGGGYKAREPDPICVIRPAAIRGHLRFWWRATVGAGFSSAADMFQAEKEIWGSAEKPGVVGIRVSIRRNGEERPYSDLVPGAVRENGPREGYFLFPFQEQRRDHVPQAKGRTNTEFDLHIDFDTRWNAKTERHEELSQEDVQSVQRAIKAWLVFGGVGARTRRGCGALRVVGTEAEKWLPQSRDVLKAWLESLIPQQGTSGNHTHLKGASIIVGEICEGQGNLDAARFAWRKLGTFWATFRKGHVPGTRANYQPMSNCDWNDYRGVLIPYSQTISPKPSLQLAKPFFGLPIEYQQFPSARYAPSIKAEESGRMASPIILKPISFADASVCPMIAVLTAPQPSKISIDGKKVGLHIPTSDKVLTALKVSHPLAAVTEAAKKIWGSTNVLEVKL